MLLATLVIASHAGSVVRNPEPLLLDGVAGGRDRPADVTPCLPGSKFRNCNIRDAKLDCEALERLALYCSLTDLDNLFIRKFGLLTILAAQISAKVLDRVSDVLGTSHPFEVLGSVVRSAAVSMVHLRTIERRRSEERLRDETMHGTCCALGSFTDTREVCYEIAILSDSRMNHVAGSTSKSPTTILLEANTPNIRNREDAFPTHNWSPLIHSTTVAPEA